MATVLCAVQCSVVCHRCHCAVARAAFPALSLYTIPMYCTVLYSTVQHCHPGFLWWGTVLGHTPCCAVMRCTHCTARHTSLSYFNIMHCTTMHCNAKMPLYCLRPAPTASDCSSPQGPGVWWCTQPGSKQETKCFVRGTLHCTAMYCTALHYTDLYSIILYLSLPSVLIVHCSVVCCIALHFTSLHCTKTKF